MNAITQSCVLFLWMHSLTFVKSQANECTLQAFINGKYYDSNFETSDMETSYAAGAQVRVGCKVGYSGFFKLMCVGGQWQRRGTPCEPRSCGHPGDAQFADFQLEKGDDFVFGSKVVYTCHKGFHMVTRINHRNCMAEGWDGIVPVCEAHKCPVMYVDDNVQVNGDPEQATFGNVVRFSCKSSMDMLIGSPEVFCDENGQWSHPTPKCKVLKCAKPEIENGDVSERKVEWREHEVLQFECRRGYKPTEHRPTQCTKQGDRAEWNPTPICEKVKCRLDLTPLEGTRYEPPFQNVFFPDDTVKVVCSEKYWISTKTETSILTQCNYDGEWSIRPVCQVVTCSNRRDRLVSRWSVYWGERILLGDTATYTCQRGYRSSDGSNLATCTRSGWSPDPLCEEIICNRLNIDNAVIRGPYREIYKYNHRADYECNRGYTGDFSLTCTEHGWTGQRRECTKITCNIIHDDDNADIAGEIKPIYQYDDQVQFVCKNGYEGRYTLTCTEHGWTKTSQCTEVLCQRPDIKNAKLTSYRRQSYRHNERVHYTCADNDSIFTATCQQGNWIGTQNCPEVLCQRPDIKNAKHTTQLRQSYRHNEYVQYTCPDNDRIFTATCQQGNWIGTQNCSEVLCQRPDIKNAKHTTQLRQSYRHNEKVHYTCADNETTSFTATCQQGNWIGTQNCSENCPKATIPNGFVVVSENKLYYTCDKGFKLVTKGWWGVAKCNRRLWSGFERCIEKKQCKEIPEIPNGKGTLQSTNRGRDELQIDCNKGYEATVKSLTCQGGQWGSAGKSVSICTIIPTNCNQPPRVENTFITSPPEKIYLSGSEVSYQCRDKYTLEGKHTLKCENGTWQESNFTCTLYCDRLQDEGETMIFDEMNEDRYVNGTVIKYECRDKVLEPQGHATCINGNWEKTVTCKDSTLDRDETTQK